MANTVTKNLISVPKRIFRENGGVVVLGLEEYKKFLKYEMEKEYIDKIVKEGLKEKREGKTESLKSFLKREYPKLYDNYKD